MDFFEASNALESLRSSDFDNLSAYAEVIDNAIQAEGKNIYIEIFSTQPRANYLAIEQMAFGDDGIGMDVETLHACLKLGWSSRYNDRAGIGRFGVGMVLGAIHECQCIEVYSKQNGGNWNYTYIDLEEIEAGKLTSIPKPEPKNVPTEYSKLVDDRSGTLVIWSKYDRQPKGAETIIAEAKDYFGRVFRNFIWDDGVVLRLNGEIIPAFDPLYVRTEKTKFPNDPTGELLESISFIWPIPMDTHQPSTNPNSVITIKMSILPEEFRKEQGDGGSAHAKERLIPDNEGVSVLRNGREVFYGIFPRWNKVKIGNKNSDTWPFEYKDRWWGCQIEFNAELDQYFSVKNIKRGAEPSIDLKQAIKQEINGTRKSVLERVSEIWIQARKDSEDKDKQLGRDPHSVAEQAVTKASILTPPSKQKANRTIEEAANEILSDLDIDDTQKAEYLVKFKKQPFTIRDSHWRGGVFWEVQHAGGHTFITYNKQHPFFVNYYDIINQIGGNNNPLALKLRALIDMLLISAAKAQGMVDGDVMSIEDFNNYWGINLKTYVETWKKENHNE